MEAEIPTGNPDSVLSHDFCTGPVPEVISVPFFFLGYLYRSGVVRSPPLRPALKENRSYD